MEEQLAAWMSTMAWPWLVLVLIITLALLAKGADWLVGEAVALSQRSGIPTVIIGATVVSLGTTTPEAAVSVMAALDGAPGLALGNAVGSVICDTGLILGLACLIGPIPLHREVVNRQGYVQLGSGLLLVVACFPWTQPATALTTGGNLERWHGVLFLVLLAAYLYQSVKWARHAPSGHDEIEENAQPESPVPVILLRLVGALVLVIIASKVLISAAVETATRLEVPDSVIAATLVAFGTSLPELVTAVTAVRRGHGELAVGNIIGADILNVLFVSGAAAAATAGGLAAGPHFFRALFPAMMAVLIVFRIGVWRSGDALRRGFGFVLVGVYIAVSIASYW